MLVSTTEIEQSGNLAYVTWTELGKAASLARQDLYVVEGVDVNVSPQIIETVKPSPGVWAIGFTLDAQRMVCLQGRGGRAHLMEFDPDLNATVCRRHPDVRVALRTEALVTEGIRVEAVT